MRTIWILLSLWIACLLPACGRDEETRPNPQEEQARRDELERLKGEARGLNEEGRALATQLEELSGAVGWPTGESVMAPVVKYPFTLRKGVGVRLTIQADMKLRVSGPEERSQSMKVGTTMELLCTEVTPSGDRVAELRMRKFKVDGVPTADPNPGVVGAMTFGPDRMAKSVELGGQLLPHKQPSANPFMTGGLSIYLPLPVGSMRVGDTVVLPSVMPANVLPPPIQRAVEESAKPPTFRGVYTLLKTHEQGGVLIGEFDIDLSLTWSGNVTMGPEEFEVVVDASCKGRQSFALGTGLPVGSGSSRVVQRLKMKADDEGSVMLTKAEIRSECEPLK